jgi:high-affinity iron transporter
MVAFNPAALLIAFREGLEIALVIGILVSYLIRTGRKEQLPSIVAGTATALLLSGIIAIVMNQIGAELEDPYEQLFEGTTMFVAVGLLTWMIFWMRYQSRFMKQELEQRMQRALSTGARVSLFALAFVVVVREGIETALFLAANAFAADGLSTLLGALIGLALAAAAGVLIYGLAVRVNLRMFFDVTSVLLVLFAAGLLAHGVHEFQEIGLLPILSATAWDTANLLSNESALGSVLRALVGYNAEPSLLEVAGYLFYWVVILLGIWRVTARLSRERLAAKP